MGPLEFLIDLFFRQLSGPRVDSSSESNECQGYLLGVKAAGAQG